MALTKEEKLQQVETIFAIIRQAIEEDKPCLLASIVDNGDSYNLSGYGDHGNVTLFANFIGRQVGKMLENAILTGKESAQK